MPLVSIDQVLSRVQGAAELPHACKSAMSLSAPCPIQQHASFISSQESSLAKQLRTPPGPSLSPITATPSLTSSPPSPPLTNPDRPSPIQDTVIDDECRSITSSLTEERCPYFRSLSENEDYDLHADSDAQNTCQDIHGARHGRQGAVSLVDPAKPPIISKRQVISADAVERSKHVRSGPVDGEDVFAQFDAETRSSSPLGSRRRKFRKTAAAFESDSVQISPVKKACKSLNFEDESVRRSSRTRMRPLEYWKNERIVYNLVRDEERGQAVPTIKSIIRASPEINEQLPKSTKRKSNPTSLETYSAPITVKTQRAIDSDLTSEFDFIDITATGEIVTEVEEYPSGERITRRVAIPSTALSYIAVSNESSNFEFAKTFEEEGGFLATGVVRLPINAGSKGCRRTRANALVFCVLEGTVMVVLNQEVAFKIQRSGHFLVPRGNSYSLENVGKEMAVLFYTQGTDSLYNVIQHQEETVKKM
ncbi:Mif2/CENP-C like-domain-containing protein [Lipomyces chichibuensis]|uniref:Mif2/CENP-C like-domain-containing protein n=1 Tax=Lipomyces chichibuensis TaxID=1546026 RepID=UPI003343428F